MSHPPLHGPAQPSWKCVNCGEDWPCDPIKAQLRGRYAETALIQAYMYPYAAVAQLELGLTDAETTERFLRWPGHHRNQASLPRLSSADLRRRVDNAAGRMYWSDRSTM